MMNSKQNIRNITDFLNTEYLEYSRYTVEDRAIPSLCDGFKPGARKIIHAANEGTIKNGGTYKLLVLSGDTMNRSQYSHGDASLNGTIAEKSKDFVNNLNALEIEGQSGSLRNPDAVGSPRYLYIRKSKYMDLIYRTDYDLLDYVFDEGMYLEPKQYLPIIPTVLTSLAMGIANGYSFHTMAYNPVHIIDACIENITKDKIKTIIHPFLRGISNDSWRYIDGHWWSYGKWKCNQSKDLLTITELPCDVTYEDFEKLLNKYKTKEFIKDYNNLSEDGKVFYEIQFPVKGLSSEIKKDPSTLTLASKFKLFKQVPDDLLWVLDEKHKLKYFNTPNDLIKYFTSWRLTIYTQRKKRLVKILEEKYKNNTELVRFIELVCKGKLKIRNRSKVDIKVDMDGFKLPMTLISTPMSKCTIEERDGLLKENEEIKKELDYIRNTTEKVMYLNDLKSLRAILIKDFPENSTIETSTDVNVEVIGEARKTKEDTEKAKLAKEKEKIKAQKQKEKLAKEKEKTKKQKEKEKAAKEKEKLLKQKEKEKKAKEKEKLLKQKEKEKKIKKREKKLKEKEKLAKQKEKLKKMKERNEKNR